MSGRACSAFKRKQSEKDVCQRQRYVYSKCARAKRLMRWLPNKSSIVAAASAMQLKNACVVGFTCRWLRRRRSRRRLSAAHKGSACSCKAAGADQPQAPPGRIHASRIGARRGWMTAQSADAAQPGPSTIRIKTCTFCMSVCLKVSASRTRHDAQTAAVSTLRELIVCCKKWSSGLSHLDHVVMTCCCSAEQWTGSQLLGHRNKIMRIHETLQ